MKSFAVSILCSITILLFAPRVYAQQVGNSHLRWLSPGSVPGLNPLDAWQVNRQLGAGRAIIGINYFTPGLPGGAPNKWTGTSDRGLTNTYAVLHDYNTHYSPFGRFVGYIDIVTPLFGITHKQVASLVAWKTSGAGYVPQVSMYNSYTTSAFRQAHRASSYGHGTASFINTDDGYRVRPKPYVPLPDGLSLVKGVLRPQGTLRPKVDSGTGYFQGGWLFSSNYQYGMAVAPDGRVVVVRFPPGGYPYAVKVLGPKGPVSDKYALIMQPDGSAVVYRPDWKRHFTLVSGGGFGTSLYLNNDGTYKLRR